MIGEKSLVVVYLKEPREKYWGLLEGLSVTGLHMRGLILNMVEDWARELARGGEVSMGPSSLFFPLLRLEKVLLDEDVGHARSVRSTFIEIVGHEPHEHLS